MADIIQLRRDTSSNWTSANPILAQGEIGIETNTLKLKIGDGSTVWNSLGYYSSVAETDPIVGAINGIVKANGAGTISAATADTDYVTPTGTTTLTNKRITPRVLSAASYTTDTGTSLNCDNLDQFIVTAQAGALKFNNPTGTPTDGQKLIIAVTGTAARALTWDTQFEASTVALPTTTVTTARLNMGFIWRADTSKWVCVAVS